MRHCLYAVVAISLMLMSRGAWAAYFGNPLVPVYHPGYLSGYNYDMAPPVVILGEYNSAGPAASSSLTFPSAGTINDVRIFSGDAGRSFAVFAIHPAGKDASGDPQFTFGDGATLTTTAAGDVETFAIPHGLQVQQGDLLAFAGQGPCLNPVGYGPQYNGDDATYQTPGMLFIATPPVPGQTYSFGTNSTTTANYAYIPAFGPARLYSIGVDFRVYSTVAD